ncbi:DUF1491 family protein [Sphingorhabdus sp.]|jgi:hypothetical protein|uniref:DUF1491 family protein n=1 Tax=Sphingorhabdus sp. TaxID=1902408 RepID=UPI002D1FA9F7|nr:DUF1491 family protein [Sphingorhabdus sp.]
MIEPRLASHMLVSGLIRQAAAHGSFAAVLRKGDRIAGAVLLLRREKGRNPALFERFPSLDGSGKWSEVTIEDIEKEEKISEILDRRAARDPDIWILELDVPSAERFTDILASMN